MLTPSQAASPLTAEQLATVRGVFAAGLDRAAASLSEMVGNEVRVLDGRAEVVSIAAAAALAGTPDASRVAVYLGITGAFNAHVVLLLTPEDADRLSGLLLGSQPDTPEDEALRESALGEVGNVMGSSFAIVLGDLIGSPLWSTPPTVRTDMARALVDGLLATVGGDQERILVIVTQFARFDVIPRFAVEGTFLVVPEPDGLATLFEAVGRA